MRDFRVITDSCSSLTPTEIAELDLVVLPLSFLLEGKSYQDIPGNSGIDPHDFYARLAEGADCKTSAVNEIQYYDRMKEEIEAGRNILCICFSSALSCTYHNACLAAESLREEYPEAKIMVVDSLSACRGMGMLITRCIREIRGKHLSLEEAAALVEREKNRQGHWFFVDDLTRLKHGGRVSSVKAFVGGLLNIKPIMHCDAQGQLTMTGKVRGTKAAYKALIEKMESTGQQITKDSEIFICHADCMNMVHVLTQMITEKFGITNIHAGNICPVIGAHTGIGTIGLFFVANER